MSIANGAPGAEVPEIDQSQYLAPPVGTIGAMAGTTERGPVNDPVLVRSWPDYLDTFGNLIASSTVAYAAKAALDLGCQLYINRITQVDGNGASLAVAATAVLKTQGGAASKGRVTGNVAGVLWQGVRTWPFTSGDQIGFVPSNTIVSQFLGSAAGTDPTAVTGLTFVNPTTARSLQVAFGAGWNGGDVKVYGTDANDASVTATFVANAGNTVTNAQVFKTVTKVTKTLVGAVQANNTAIVTDSASVKSTATITAHAAAYVTPAATFNANHGQTITYKSGPSYAPGPLRTITLSAAVTDGAVTAAQLQAEIGAQGVGISAAVTGGGTTVTVTSDLAGSDSQIVWVGGTALAAIGLAPNTTTLPQAGSNVADVDHVTSVEINAAITALSGEVVVGEDASHFLYMECVHAGASHSLQITNTGNEALGVADTGWDTAVHAGSSSAPVATVQVTAGRLGQADPGVWGNSLSVLAQPATNNLTDRFRMLVYRNGLLAENAWEDLSMDPADASGRYYLNVINDASTGSHFITVEDLGAFTSLGSAALSRPNTTAVGNTDAQSANGSDAYSAVATNLHALGQVSDGGAAGDDGIASLATADWLGDAAHKTGIYAWDHVRDAVIVGSPGMVVRSYLSTLFSYVAARADMIAVADVPQTVDVNGAIDFRKGTGAYADGLGPFNSSYGALYFNYTGIIDPVYKIERFISPMGQVFASYARADKVKGPWLAPAGGRRGLVQNITRFYSKFSDADVGALNVAAVNPLYVDPDFGPVIWGQRTLQAIASKLDRVNVRRLLIYMRRTLLPQLKFTVFEPNTPATWLELSQLVDPFLAQLYADGAFAAKPVFRCDATTNPPQKIAQHILTANIFIVPADTAEYVVVPLILESNGTSASLNEAPA